MCPMLKKTLDIWAHNLLFLIMIKFRFITAYLLNYIYNDVVYGLAISPEKRILLLQFSIDEMRGFYHYISKEDFQTITDEIIH